HVAALPPAANGITAGAAAPVIPSHDGFARGDGACARRKAQPAPNTASVAAAGVLVVNAAPVRRGRNSASPAALIFRLMTITAARVAPPAAQVRCASMAH